MSRTTLSRACCLRVVHVSGRRSRWQVGNLGTTLFAFEACYFTSPCSSTCPMTYGMHVCPTALLSCSGINHVRGELESAGCIGHNRCSASRQMHTNNSHCMDAGAVSKQQGCRFRELTQQVLKQHGAASLLHADTAAVLLYRAACRHDAASSCC